MSAYPGEKIDLYDVVLVSGPGNLQPQLWNLDPVPARAGAAVTVNAGDDFYVYAHWAKLLDTADVIAACNWVLKVAGGSATIEVSQSYDLGWSYSGTFQWIAQRTLSASAGRIVEPLAPAEYWTQTYLWADYGALLFRVKVLSGSLELEELSLQVEGPAGLLEITDSYWSDWVESPEVTLTAKQRYAKIYSEMEGTWVTAPSLDEMNRVLADGARAGGSGPVSSLNPLAINSPAIVISSPQSSGLSVTVDDDMYVGFSGFGNPYSYAGFATVHVGYLEAIWEANPSFRQLPSNFSGARNRDFVPIPSTESSYAGIVQFAEGDTIAAGWADGTVAGSPILNHNQWGMRSYINLLPTGLPPQWQSGTTVAWPPVLGSHMLGTVEPLALNAETNNGLSQGFTLPSPPAQAGSNYAVSIRSEIYEGADFPDVHGFPDSWGGSLNGFFPRIRHRMPNWRYLLPVFGPHPDAVLGDHAPPPGYFLTPSQTIDGDPGSVEVYFFVP